MANKKEIISFTGSSAETILWTPARLANFGVFPEIELYIQGPDGLYYKSYIQPVPDAPPPAFTQLDIYMGVPQNGFITIM